MRSTTARLSRWVAIPALLLALTLSGPVGPAAAQGADENTEVRGEQILALSVVGARDPSFLFPEMKRIPGFGWEIDSGGPAVLIKNTADEW